MLVSATLISGSDLPRTFRSVSRPAAVASIGVTSTNNRPPASRIGAFVEIQKGASVGERCKISSHTFVCEGVTIEDECFVGHGVMFTNDRFPRATNADGSAQTDADWNLEYTTVKRRASIGSNATIVCGIVVGEGSTKADKGKQDLLGGQFIWTDRFVKQVGEWKVVASQITPVLEK